MMFIKFHGFPFCFVEADEEFIEELRNTSEKKQSKKKYGFRTNIFHEWAKTSGKNEQLES